MKSNHSDELLTLCLEQYQSELDLQLSHHSMTYGRLEQLLARHKETQVAKLNKIHDREVGDLKKKQDSQNWEEMKTLAKKYKDKNELARYVNFTNYMEAWIQLLLCIFCMVWKQKFLYHQRVFQIPVSLA